MVFCSKNVPSSGRVEQTDALPETPVHHRRDNSWAVDFCDFLKEQAF